jgi:hypothetical protein
MIGGILTASIALAAADIPTRYVGAFPAHFPPPSSRFSAFTDITGVFAGKSLVLRYVAVLRKENRRIPTTARYSCTVVPPSKTTCSGRFRVDGGGMEGSADVEISWKDGRPVLTHFGKRKG